MKKSKKQQIKETFEEVSKWELTPSHLVIKGILIDLSKPEDRVVARELLFDDNEKFIKKHLKQEK